MLTAMRKGSDNWFIKIFLGIVVLGFIATGGLVSYSSVQSNSNVASVGDVDVAAGDFYNEYSRQINLETRRSGRDLHPLMAKYIEQSVLNTSVNRAAMENTGIVFNLAIDDKLASAEILADRNFIGNDGKFSKAVFDGILRRNNFTEKSYVALIKKQQLIDQLTGGLANIKASPKIFVNLLNQYANEQRIAEYFHVKQSAIKIGNIPAGEALVTYYKTVIGQFAAPEYRGVELLHLDPVKLAKTIKPNATEVKELYELSKDSYNRAETREISQIIYPNMEAAQAAYEQSLKGTTFAELLAEQNIDVANATLGVFAKDGLPNKKMADVVFDLDINKISMPVDIGLGIVLLSVSNITPADIKTFDDVKQIIEDKESLRLAIDKIYELRDDVEDEIASGATFKEVADKLSIDLTIISTLNNQLQDIEGGKVSIPAVNGLAQSIFTSEIDLDNDPLDTISGGLIWFRVVNIIETRDKKLTEVKDDVTALWQSTETDKALLAKAKELSKKGGDIDALSNTFADAIKTTTELKRGDLNVDFSAQAIKALFSVKQGEYTYIAGNVNDEKSYIVMQLKEIIAPNNQDVDNINNQIRQAMAPNLAATLIESYVENNKQVYGTAINQPLIDRIVGEQPQY